MIIGRCGMSAPRLRRRMMDFFAASRENGRESPSSVEEEKPAGRECRALACALPPRDLSWREIVSTLI